MSRTLSRFWLEVKIALLTESYYDLSIGGITTPYRILSIIKLRFSKDNL